MGDLQAAPHPDSDLQPDCGPRGTPMKLMLGGMTGWLDEAFNLNQE
jgi:hypothetical protein